MAGEEDAQVLRAGPDSGLAGGARVVAGGLEAQTSVAGRTVDRYMLRNGDHAEHGTVKKSRQRSEGGVASTGLLALSSAAALVAAVTVAGWHVTAGRGWWWMQRPAPIRAAGPP